MKHLPFDDPEVTEIMKGWPEQDRRSALLDAALYGNIYVDPQGAYVPARLVTE